MKIYTETETQIEIYLKLIVTENWNETETLLSRGKYLPNKLHNGVEGKNLHFKKKEKSGSKKFKNNEGKKGQWRGKKESKHNHKNVKKNAKTGIINLSK